MVAIVLFITVPGTILTAFFAFVAYDEGKSDCGLNQKYPDNRKEYENNYIIPFA